MSDVGEGLADLNASMNAQRIDLVAENKVVAQAVSGPGIVVSLPSVFSKRNDLEVFGTVTRRPNNDGPVGGFLDVEIRSSNGVLLDQSLIHWVPDLIPTDGTRSSKYSAHPRHPAGWLCRVAWLTSPKWPISTSRSARPNMAAVVAASATAAEAGTARMEAATANCPFSCHRPRFGNAALPLAVSHPRSPTPTGPAEPQA